VNTAKHRVPGRIHVAEATFAMLHDTFELEAREPIEIKGKGRMQTYWIVGKRETMSPGRGAATDSG
jgi:adenylate cyclase